MPNGTEKAILRIRSGIYKRYKKQFEAEHNPTGENYEKVRSLPMKPFNITDMRAENETLREKRAKETVHCIQLKLNGNRCFINQG